MSPNGRLDPENVGIAVGISLISCLRAQRHAIEVERSPTWIFPLPVWSHSIFMSPNGMLDPEKSGMAVGISLISCLGAEIHAFEVKRPPSWICPLSVSPHIISVSPIGKLDSENIGIAVGISLISCLGGEISAITVQRPPSWIFPLPVRSHCLPTSFSRLLEPQHLAVVAVAVEISYISCLGAELFAFEVFRPPS